MVFQKLLKVTIIDALNLVWSETGITPSKQTRQTILEAAEKISNDMEQDFKSANKEEILKKQDWNKLAFLPPPSERKLPAAEEAAILS